MSVSLNLIFAEYEKPQIFTFLPLEFANLTFYKTANFVSTK